MYKNSIFEVKKNPRSGFISRQNWKKEKKSYTEVTYTNHERQMRMKNDQTITVELQKWVVHINE